ncbi:hypothetical protein K1T71_004996 [Dendrolimus kikuchii]|uniref:Uncharacterized protein n=1 Tax=Dendrolimus kikuchii TaxID=765133 RepID=A0ACC1D5Q9_9NEOP|nr:hypothetical protein K1T71_004996 [Dendrolimus kikuchii]
MPCGKRPLIKSWDKPRHIRVITPSRYEQNEASVKLHWKEVVKNLELSYKDDQFWDSQCDEVRTLVGPVIFQRIAKIFNLPLEATKYQPKSETSSLAPSAQFYMARSRDQVHQGSYTGSEFEESAEELDEEGLEEQSEIWSVSSVAQSLELKKSSRFKSATKSKSFALSKTFSKRLSKSTSKFFSRTLIKSISSKFKTEESSSEESASTADDVMVHPASRYYVKIRPYQKGIKNPHYEMLYCNESETDMIKWNSKYKQKTFEVSASDEFSKKAEIMTKKISIDFYEWWVGLGNVEFKSEIKRPEDIEDLFQVWFEEHASRGLVLHPKILPCVLKSIAEFIGVPKTSCPKVLKRQIAYDVNAETSPAHTMAFGTCLPQKMKHLPPRNNTKTLWRGVKIPEDLRTMSCVFDDVKHLTSTKAFQKWLKVRSNLPMPPCLKGLDSLGDKKQLFVVPSDYMITDKSSSTSQELALPVSQFSLELKDVLSKLMNQ